MFYNCKNLSEIISNNNEINTILVETMASMFYGCLSLITIPYLYMNNCIILSSMFQSCKSLTKIYNMEEKAFNTSNATNMEYMFSQCTNLLYLPILNTSSCKNLTSTFYNCISMTGNPTPTDYWNNTNQPVHDNCFYKCEKLNNYNTEIPAD